MKLLKYLFKIDIFFFNIVWHKLLKKFTETKIKKNVINYRQALSLLYGKNNSKTIKVRLRDGSHFYTKKDTLPSIFEIYLWHDYDRYPKFSISKKDIVVDLGANIGAFSVYAGKKGAKVIALEPLQSTYKTLVKNIIINSLSKNVFPLNYGIWINNKNQKIFINKNTSLGNSLINNQNSKYKIIKCITLAKLIKKYKIKKIDYLKCDIEGAEYPLFFNLNHDIFSKISRIVIEYHNFRDTPKEFSYKNLKKCLEKNGFKVFRLIPFYIYAERNLKEI